MTHVPLSAYMVGRCRPWQCNHYPWNANTVELRQAWHAIIALGKYTRSDDVGRGMLTMFLKSTHDRKMSRVFLHGPWEAHKAGRRQALNAIIALGQHKWLGYVGYVMLSSSLEAYTIERSQA